MGFFDFFKTPDIDQAITNYRQTDGAVLLDVRTPQEYREGHIPGSKNTPLSTLERSNPLHFQKNTPLFVYCRSGSRSRQASSLLKQMGYTNVQNAGGILFYNGKITK